MFYKPIASFTTKPIDLHHNSRVKLYLFFCCVLLAAIARAQLCTGSLGDPVVNITFGAGANPGPPLSAATTNYTYVNNACPVNGFYTVLNSGINCNYGWHILTSDHTGNPNGYFMLVDASFEPSDFYLDTVKNLCANTTYEFASWILNMKNITQGIRPNITFKIETTTGVVLQSYNTGDIPVEQVITWRQYGFFFTTPATISNIVLRMTNNAPGGDGNDLALDDITFRPCGPLVTASIAGGNGGTTNLCTGSTTSLTFNAAISTGYTAPAYQWQQSTDNGMSWTDIPGAVSSSYTRPPTGTGNYQYRLTVAESGNITLTNCRVASNALTVNVNPNPVTTASNNSPQCEGNTVTLNATGGTSYNWTGPNSFTGSGQSISINNASAAAAGKYYVTVTNNFNCSSTDSSIITLYSKPVAIFNTVAPACEKNNTGFTDQSTATGQNIIKWNWDFGDGTIATTTSPSHIFATANTYTVSLIVETDKGCKSAAAQQQVMIHYLPFVNFGLPEVCLTDPFAAFSDSSSINDNSESQFLYLWNFGDPNAGPANPNTSTQKNPQHSYTAVGVYPVQLTVVSKDGCIKDSTKLFTVNGSQPLAMFTVENNAALCSNRDMTITDGSTVNFGNITRIEIYWDYQNDPTIKTTDEFPVTGKKYTHHYPDFGTPATKSFQLRYVAYSGISCINQTTQIITVKASPQLSFAAINPVCEEITPFTITQASEVNGMAGSAVYSGAGLSSNGLFDPYAAKAGQHILRYTFTAANGCTAFAEQTIFVYPQPAVDAGPDRTVLEGGTITLAASGTGNTVSYLWTPDIYMDNNHILNPKISPAADIMYTLTVTSTDGCVNSDKMQVTLLKKPIVPNAFSPNADGINDSWVIQYLESYPGATVDVFNRYGQVVYHSEGYSKAWDGTYKGKPLPFGTYYWIINPRNGRKQMNGSVTIVK